MEQMTENTAAGSCRLGIDIGSTTVKAAALDDNGSLLMSCYERHCCDIIQTLTAILERLSSRLGACPVLVSVTGSGGLSLADKLALPFVQEVVAETKAVRLRYPDVTAVLELGGEDAKLTFFDPAPDHRMNGICAGGTGAFIDQMAQLLSTDAAGVDHLAADSRTLYPVAARCGVFAKTDVQALLNEGARREDIAASVFQAVVNQTIGGLAAGRKIRGKLCFLGGPLYFLPQLRRRFCETLKLGETDIILPEDAPVFVAIGAALSSADTAQTLTVGALLDKVHALAQADMPATPRLQPLFESPEDYALFCARHNEHCVGRRDLAYYQGDSFLGLDVGSTTCKCVLLDTDSNLLYSDYVTNEGRPLDCASKMLKNLYRSLPQGVTIARAAVTGYGEKLIKTAFSADMGEVETVAHATAAEFMLPGVETIVDIGGQDMKYLTVQNGVIDNVILNEACSSGCGSFLQTFAQSAGADVAAFAKEAVFAPSPVDLGSRCTVFMNSRVRQAQKEGAVLGDIAAGLCCAVVKNALFKVVKLKDPSQLGAHVVVQGGTFKNDAVLRAFERIAGREAVRPDIPELMGAFGAALLAKKTAQPGTVSTLINPQALDAFAYTTSSARCGRCANNCLLTVTRFSGGAKLVAGNRCERGTGEDECTSAVNLYDYKYHRLFDYQPLDEIKAPRGVIGIPRVLNMYENYPFWYTFFTALGFRVLLSPPSSRALYELGLDSISSDTACYPAKLANGHVVWLIEQGVRHIFLPCVPKERAECAGADNHYNCPIVACYAEVLKSNIGLIKERGVHFHNPFLPYHHKRPLVDRLFKEFEEFELSYDEVKRAVEAAWAEDIRFKADIRQQGEKVLRALEETGQKGIVLSGRPYHLDPEVHHGIPNLIASMGVAVLTEDAVAHLGQVERPLRVLDQWMYHTRLYEAADVVSKRAALELVQLDSFGCGPDSIAAEQAQEILAKRHKLYTMIKIDEITNLGAVRIRIRSLLAAVSARDKAKSAVPTAERVHSTVRPGESMPQRQMTIIGPQMAPIHFALIEEAIRSEGYRFDILKTVTNEDIEEGLKYVNNDSCYPAIIIIGQLLRALKSGRYDPNTTALLMCQTGGPCRASNYVALLESALIKNGLGHVPIISLTVSKHAHHTRFKITPNLVKKAAMAMLYGDLLMKVLYRTRPYERVPGSTDALFDHWMDVCKSNMASADRRVFKAHLMGIVRDFERLELSTETKTKVGLVGEILVKYHPTANNNMADFLEQSGSELLVPALTDFFLYCALVRKFSRQYSNSSVLSGAAGQLFVRYIERLRDDMRDALRESGRFTLPPTIYELTEKAQDFLSLCNHTGEGWLLTAEILDLIDSGADSIICMQPFACLPNHISGRGMLKAIKERYPRVSIIALDYDAGASQVNQINRIKMMLESSKAP